MVRARLDDFWIEWMRTLFENDPRLPDKVIAERAKLRGEELGRSDYPALRTVNKYHREFPDLKDDVRRGYRYFHWPESMKLTDLPWEASATALELLMLLDGVGVQHRPPIRLVEWYWRVRTASPDISREDSFVIALGLDRREEKGEPIGDRGAEWYMAYHSVPGKEGQDAYRKAKERKEDPIPPYRARYSIDLKGGPDSEFWLQFSIASMRAPRRDTA